MEVTITGSPGAIGGLGDVSAENFVSAVAEPGN